MSISTSLLKGPLSSAEDSSTVKTTSSSCSYFAMNPSTFLFYFIIALLYHSTTESFSKTLLGHLVFITHPWL
jgi:hypothetical protein